MNLKANVFAGNLNVSGIVLPDLVTYTSRGAKQKQGGKRQNRFEGQGNRRNLRKTRPELKETTGWEFRAHRASMRLL